MLCPSVTYVFSLNLLVMHCPMVAYTHTPNGEKVYKYVIFAL